MIIDFIKVFPRLLSDAFKELRKNDPLRLAAATAFFTTFALPPILIILIQLFGSIFSIENFNDRFFIELSNVLGKESTDQIRETFKGFKAQASNELITIGGVIFLIFVATTLFKIIKDSLNQLWNIKLDDSRNLKIKLEKRLISMVVILLGGLLFIAGMIADSLQIFLGKYLDDLFPGSGYRVNTFMNVLISMLVVTTWFVILFKVLPDARPRWKVVIWGGVFTGFLFTIGKFIIRQMLTLGNIHSVFGASTSIVILLLFVFYSSFILYFGACFTKVFAIECGTPIEPAEHAVKYELVERKAE